LLDEAVATDNAHDELAADFPSRELKEPFYWYASQEAYRAYLPERQGPDWADYGSVAAYCPPGSQANPYSPAVPARLLQG
jgi:hypothetical protein